MMWLLVILFACVWALCSVCVIGLVARAYWRHTKASRALPQVSISAAVHVQYGRPLEPAPRQVTKRIRASELRPDDRPLMPASQYRYKIERVRAVERQPIGRVVAMLQSEDDDGMPVIRPHEWRDPSERVTVLVDNFVFDLDEHGGDYGSLYGRFGQQQQEQQEQRSTELLPALGGQSDGSRGDPEGNASSPTDPALGQ